MNLLNHFDFDNCQIDLSFANRSALLPTVYFGKKFSKVITLRNVDNRTKKKEIILILIEVIRLRYNEFSAQSNRRKHILQTKDGGAAHVSFHRISRHSVVVTKG